MFNKIFREGKIIMNKIITTSLLITILLLSSCTTKPSSNEQKEPVEKNNNKESQIVTEQDSESREWQETAVTPNSIIEINFKNATTTSDIKETNKYQLKFKVPKTWEWDDNGDFHDDNERRLEGLGCLYRMTGDFVLDSNVRNLYNGGGIINVDNSIIKEGLTEAGYKYIQYSYPQTKESTKASYWNYIQVSDEFIMVFHTYLEIEDKNKMQIIMDSMVFSEVKS